MQSCKPHAPQASPPPAVDTPRSNLMYLTAEGLLGDIAGVGGVADDAETDIAEAETAAEVACQLSAHLTSASAAPPVAATPVSAVPPRPAFYQTLDAINGFQQVALVPGDMRDTALRMPARTPLPPIQRAPVPQHPAAPVMPTPPPPTSYPRLEEPTHLGAASNLGFLSDHGGPRAAQGSPEGTQGAPGPAAPTPWHPPPHPTPQWAPTPEAVQGAWTSPAYAYAPGVMFGGWSPGPSPALLGHGPGGYGAGGGFPYALSGLGPPPSGRPPASTPAWRWRWRRRRPSSSSRWWRRRRRARHAS